MMMMKPVVFATAITLATGQAAQAAPCTALADFFVRVVEAAETEIDKEKLGAQYTAITESKGLCAGAIAEMAEAGSYSHKIGAPLTPLQEYLDEDAVFDVRVIGSGDEIKAIQFDTDAIAVLRRRPTR